MVKIKKGDLIQDSGGVIETAGDDFDTDSYRLVARCTASPQQASSCWAFWELVENESQEHPKPLLTRAELQLIENALEALLGTRPYVSDLIERLETVTAKEASSEPSEGAVPAPAPGLTEADVERLIDATLERAVVSLVGPGLRVVGWRADEFPGVTPAAIVRAGLKGVL